MLYVSDPRLVNPGTCFALILILFTLVRRSQYALVWRSFIHDHVLYVPMLSGTRRVCGTSRAQSLQQLHAHLLAGIHRSPSPCIRHCMCDVLYDLYDPTVLVVQSSVAVDRYQAPAGYRPCPCRALITRHAKTWHEAHWGWFKAVSCAYFISLYTF